MRNAFAEEMTKLADRNEKLVLLSGDIGNRMFDAFQARAADRFYNCGVAEANMMSVAAGLAMSGLRPVVYTITPFTTTRCYEQIRVDVCYHCAPVIIVGTGAGLSYATLGPTHHSLEDIAILRALPGMTVFCPCDAWEVRAGLQAALKQEGPVYIRLGKKGEPLVHSALPEITLGKSYTLRQGKDVCILSTGNIMNLAMEVADTLAARGLSVRLDSFHTVKPLDEATLTQVFKQFKTVLVMEEHGIIGGFYSAVAEWVAAQPNKPAAHLLGFGTADRFHHRVASQEQIRAENGLTVDAVVGKALSAMAA